MPRIALKKSPVIIPANPSVQSSPSGGEIPDVIDLPWTDNFVPGLRHNLKSSSKIGNKEKPHLVIVARVTVPELALDQRSVLMGSLAVVWLFIGKGQVLRQCACTNAHCVEKRVVLLRLVGRITHGAMLFNVEKGH